MGGIQKRPFIKEVRNRAFGSDAKKKKSVKGTLQPAGDLTT